MNRASPWQIKISAYIPACVWFTVLNILTFLSLLDFDIIMTSPSLGCYFFAMIRLLSTLSNSPAMLQSFHNLLFSQWFKFLGTSIGYSFCTTWQCRPAGWVNYMYNSAHESSTRTLVTRWPACMAMLRTNKTEERPYGLCISCTGRQITQFTQTVLLLHTVKYLTAELDERFNNVHHF